MSPTDEHFREIGRISVTFNKLESLLRFGVVTLLEVDDEVVNIAIRGDQFQALVAKFKDLVKLRFEDEPELRDSALEWIRGAEAANEGRIGVIHASWIQSPTDPERAIVLRLNRSGKRFGALVTAERVRDQADAMEEIVRRGQELFKLMNLF